MHSIDDLGDEWRSESGFSDHVLRRLLTRRERDDALTIITTNLTKRQFAERYGARITSRIAGSGCWVQLEGEDMRVAEKRAKGGDA